MSLYSIITEQTKDYVLNVRISTPCTAIVSFCIVAIKIANRNQNWMINQNKMKWSHSFFVSLSLSPTSTDFAMENFYSECTIKSSGIIKENVSKMKPKWIKLRQNKCDARAIREILTESCHHLLPLFCFHRIFGSKLSG